MRTSSATRIRAAGAADRAVAAVVFERRLRPHRSLRPRGYVALIAAFGASSLISGVFFLAIGAWPIFGFYGIDVALLWGLMHLDRRRAGRLTETIRLTADALTIEHGDCRGAFGRIALQPWWLRVAVDDTELGGNRVTLSTHGQTVTVGAFLSPPERLALAADLCAALDRLRGGR
jgi:uncharacterized membrane protein